MQVIQWQYHIISLTDSVCVLLYRKSHHHHICSSHHVLANIFHALRLASGLWVLYLPAGLWASRRCCVPAITCCKYCCIFNALADSGSVPTWASRRSCVAATPLPVPLLPNDRGCFLSLLTAARTRGPKEGPLIHIIHTYKHVYYIRSYGVSGVICTYYISHVCMPTISYIRMYVCIS